MYNTIISETGKLLSLLVDKGELKRKINNQVSLVHRNVMPDFLKGRLLGSTVGWVENPMVNNI